MFSDGAYRFPHKIIIANCTIINIEKFISVSFTSTGGTSNTYSFGQWMQTSISGIYLVLFVMLWKSHIICLYHGSLYCNGLRANC